MFAGIMQALLFMGNPEIVDHVRGRVYDATPPRSKDLRVDFLRLCATVGAVDCPAYDPWVAALQERGWLPSSPDLEPNPDGPGKIGRWRLTDTGRGEWAKIEGRLE